MNCPDLLEGTEVAAKEKCRPRMLSGPAFSRCAAKTELCVTVVSLSPGFFQFRGLHGLSVDDVSPSGFSRRPVLRTENRNSRIEDRKSAKRFLLRKEVIQPQVPLRLPCYDFIPVTAHSVEGCFPCGLARRLRLQTTSMM